MTDRESRTEVYEQHRLLPWNRLEVNKAHNQRQHYGNLKELAVSLDEHGQIIAMIGIPLDDGRVSIRDGFSRMECVEKGLAPKFAAQDEYKVTVLTDNRGNPLPEREVHRYVAAINRKRRNWSALEEGHYFANEVEYAVEERLEEINNTREADGQAPLDILPAEERSRVYKATLAELASEEGMSASRIEARIELTRLPRCVRHALERRLLVPSTAREFKGLTDEEARKRIAELLRRERNYQIDWEAMERGQDFLFPVDSEESSEPKESSEPAWTEPAEDGTTVSSVPAGGRSGPRPGIIPSLSSGKPVNLMPPQTKATGGNGSAVAGGSTPETGGAPETAVEKPDADDASAAKSGNRRKTAMADAKPAPVVEEPGEATRREIKEQGDPDPDAKVEDARRTLNRKTVRESMGKKGTTRARARKVKELTEALDHYEARKAKGDEKAAFAVRLLRWVMGETSRRP